MWIDQMQVELIQKDEKWIQIMLQDTEVYIIVMTFIKKDSETLSYEAIKVSTCDVS